MASHSDHNSNGINATNFMKKAENKRHRNKSSVNTLDDPEHEAELRYAKENGLPKPTLEVKKHRSIEHQQNTVSNNRNRSKSTSDATHVSPKLKSCKADRRARCRGVSGSYSKKDGRRFEFGLDDWDNELEDEMSSSENDDLPSDSTFVQYVYRFDTAKVEGAIMEFFSNGDIECIINELQGQVFNIESKRALVEMLIFHSANSQVSATLAYSLLETLFLLDYVNERAFLDIVEKLFTHLANHLLDNPLIFQSLAIIIAKTIADGYITRLNFDDLVSKMNVYDLAIRCSKDVYYYINNKFVLQGKFQPSGSYHSLKDLENQMDKILREFLVGGDEIEVGKRLYSMRCQHYLHHFVYRVGFYALERMNLPLMDKLAHLLSYLLEAGFLLESSLTPGLNCLLISLNDISIDVPAAYTLCELWFKHCLKYKLMENSLLESLSIGPSRSRALSEMCDGKLVCMNNKDPSSELKNLSITAGGDKKPSRDNI